MSPGRKALIIDESAMLLRYAANVLATRLPGLEVLTARRGNEGFYLADRERPDLILVAHALPDTPGEAFCQRLGDHPGTADVPVILMCGKGMAPPPSGPGRRNVVGTLTKPFTPEELSHAVHGALDGGLRPLPVPDGEEEGLGTRGNRVRLQVPPPAHPPGAPVSRVLFRGATASFSLKAALQAAVGAREPGILRFTVPAGTHDTPELPPQPTEVYLRVGGVALVTTRDFEVYGATPLAVDEMAIAALRREQGATGCPPFLALLAGGQMPESDALQATSEHGQRLFARLWTRGLLDFEFEPLTELPDFARRLPERIPSSPPPKELDGLDEATCESLRLDEWLLGTLRRLRPEDLPELAQGNTSQFDGVPAYTREGYAAIRRLQLTDLEAAFARQVNGRSDLSTLANRLGLGTPAVFLLLFRFRSVGLMELWPASALVQQQSHAAPPPDTGDGPPSSVVGPGLAS